MIGSMGRPARRTGTDRERVTTVTGPADQRPAASETRINTSITSSGDRAAIESALSQAEACVARMQPSPGTRRLTLALEIFRHAVDSWSACPPTEEELELLREHVDEVLDLAQGSVPTVPLPRPA